MFSRSSYPMGLSQILNNLTGSNKSNMAAFKPDVLTSKLVDKIGTKVQRLYLYIYIYVYIYMFTRYQVTYKPYLL